MRSVRPLALLVLSLAGCSDSDDPTGPGNGPTGPPVIEQFLTTDATLTHGDYATLRWRVAGADDVAILPDVGSVASPATGSASIRPYQGTTYTLTARNEDGAVTASVTVEVDYFGGVYVNPGGGDDAAAGGSPQEAVATLQEAMARTAGGGSIYLAAGVYDAAVVIDGAERAIFGGLHPTTFFEGGESYETWIRPSSAATPIVVQNAAAGATILSGVKLDPRNGGAVALEVADSGVLLEDCVLDARVSGTGTALLIRGNSNVEAYRTRVFGGREVGAHTETRGAAVLDASSALFSNCFIDGGTAIERSSGVDVATSGGVRLGFNTIGAQVSDPGAGRVAAAVRIRAGRPSLGGNILFTRGSAKRHGVAEEAADADPAWLMGNLFISAGTPPYDNFDAEDPFTEEQLNEALYVNDDEGTLFINRLVTDVSAQTVLENLDQVDFHLADTSPDPNPAVNRGDPFLLNEERFGYSPTDIDGKARPSSPSLYDVGADER